MFSAAARLLVSGPERSRSRADLPHPRECECRSRPRELRCTCMSPGARPRRVGWVTEPGRRPALRAERVRDASDRDTRREMNAGPAGLCRQLQVGRRATALRERDVEAGGAACAQARRETRRRQLADERIGPRGRRPTARTEAPLASDERSRQSEVDGPRRHPDDDEVRALPVAQRHAELVASAFEVDSPVDAGEMTASE